MAKQQLFLGGDDLAKRIAARIGNASHEIPYRQRARKTLVQYERSSADRDSAIRAVYASGAYILKAIGEHFVHYATVSRLARKAMR